MTMSVTIKRDTSGADHEAEVRVLDNTSTGKRLASAHPLKVGEEFQVNIWGTRSIEVCEVSRYAGISDVEKLAEVEPIMQFFAYEHLPPHLQIVSMTFAQAAAFVVDTLPRNDERSVALRKLLEAKDAAVRAWLAR